MIRIRNKALLRFASLLAGDKEARRAFRIMHSPEAASIQIGGYGKVYLPHYNQSAEYESAEPDIYNSAGECIRTLFFRDIHSSYTSSLQGRRIFFDKYNFGLKNHLYTHRSMLETMGKPDHRFGLLGETPGIVPFDYRLFDYYPGLEKDFDLIFTYDQRLLEKLPNARFLPYCAQIKLDFHDINGSLALMRSDAYQNKAKDLSVLSSNKVMCELHKLRIDFAEYAKRNSVCDTFGTFDGGGYVRAIDTLMPYRFSVVVENALDEYLFTEKLTNCFACQTVPVYIGPRGVGKFFNDDGIIRVEDCSLGGILQAIRQCTEQEYLHRLPAILDNYQRVQQFDNITDMMYEKYLKDII